MDHHMTHGLQLLSYDKIYTTSIRPKLEAIDIFLKENTAPFNVCDVAHILEIDTDEVNTLIQNLNITHIHLADFFSIVFNASSEVCKLLSRQWQYSNVHVYTPEMIAEIYKLNIHKVRLAFADLGIDQITDMQLDHIFKRIHLTVF